MARQKITIEDRLREFCCTATMEQIRAAQAMLDLAAHIRMGGNGEPAKRERKPRQPKADQAKLAGVE